jgi:hypothetical protein
MKLSLRLNHFFRSFWRIEKMLDFNLYDVKYLDLTILTRYGLRQWYVDFFERNIALKQSKKARKDLYKLSQKKLDVSYWDTYNIHRMGFSNHNTRVFVREDMRSIKSLRYIIKYIDCHYTDSNLPDMIRNIYTMNSRHNITIDLLGIKNHRTDNADNKYISRIVKGQDIEAYKNNIWKLSHIKLPNHKHYTIWERYIIDNVFNKKLDLIETYLLM